MALANRIQLMRGRFSHSSTVQRAQLYMSKPCMVWMSERLSRWLRVWECAAFSCWMLLAAMWDKLQPALAKYEDAVVPQAESLHAH